MGAGRRDRRQRPATGWAKRSGWTGSAFVRAEGSPPRGEVIQPSGSLGASQPASTRKSIALHWMSVFDKALVFLAPRRLGCQPDCPERS